MTELLPWTPVAGGLRLTVKVTPRAKRSECAGIIGIAEGKSALAIRLAAPPVDGSANEALRAYLAQQLGIARSAVAIRSGAKARIKHIQLGGDAVAMAKRLSALAGT